MMHVFSAASSLDLAAVNDIEIWKLPAHMGMIWKISYKGNKIRKQAEFPDATFRWDSGCKHICSPYSN